MSFADIPEVSGDFKNFKKTEFLSLTPGMHIIRILDDKAHMVYTHYLVTRTGSYTVECLGEDCPICKNNKQIIYEHPEDFRDVRGYASRSPRFFFNVLDRSQAKVCPSCGTVNKKLPNQSWASQCSKCGALLTTVDPVQLNKVSVVGTGKTLAQNLVSFERAYLDDNGEPIGLKNFDIILSVEMQNKKKVITPLPSTSSLMKREEINVPEDQKFDLTKCTIKLETEEIQDLIDGVSLKDIFTARKKPVSTGQVNEEKQQVIEDELAEESQEMINHLTDLFG